MSFLELHTVTKTYGTVTALDSIDLSVRQGSRTAIVGPSGSGKTSILRIIAGFEAPNAGSVTLDGTTLADGTTSVPAYKRGIGIVAQDGALFPHLDVAGNIGFGLALCDPQRNERIVQLIDMVGLSASMLKRKPDQLSGGQQQRVALARALALRPRLMLLDEPFSALDTALRLSTRKAVAELLRQEQVTTILVTHDQEEALSFADQVAVMHGGRLLQVGSPHELYWHPRTAMIAEFLGDALLLPGRVAEGWAQCALGKMPVGNAAFQGTAQILLRPQQVSLQPRPAKPNGGVLGEVIDIDFAGSSSTLAIRLMEGDAPVVMLRTSLTEPFTRGDVIELVVTGKAHMVD
ncbi:MAG TPA: ABC transporter ATP-binding protein [Ancylobacter sp.]